MIFNYRSYELINQLVNIDYNNIIKINNIVNINLDNQLYYININGYNITMELYKLYSYVIGMGLHDNNTSSNIKLNTENLDKNLDKNYNDQLTCDMLHSTLKHVGVYLCFYITIFVSLIFLLMSMCLPIGGGDSISDIITQLCYRLQVHNRIAYAPLSLSSSSVQWDRSISLIMSLLGVGEVSIFHKKLYVVSYI